MHKIKSIEEVNIKGKRILVRIDINSVIIGKEPIDSPRFKRHAKTISFLARKKAKIALLAHQGRKKEKDYLPSLNKHAKILSKYAKLKIKYVDDLFGKKARRAIMSLKEGEAILLENVRNYKDETSPFSDNNRYPMLCNYFNLYVNDAFSVCHREQGSVILPPRYIKSYAGPSLERELSALHNFALAKNARKKIVYILGGEKLEDYFPIFKSLISGDSKIISAGVLANGILIFNGLNLGYENKWFKKMGYFKYEKILKSLIKRHREKIILPVDFAVGDKDAYKTRKRKEIRIDELPAEKKLWDIGHETVESFKQHLKKADAVFMKGPLGFSEIPVFSYGTTQILRHLAKITRTKDVLSILGGGHLTTTLNKYSLPKTFSHISLAGGATILYLAGEKLPGINALEQNLK